MDLSKLSKWELENRERVLDIEKNMSNEEDQNFIENFFKKMWDHLDYQNETRPVILMSTPSKTGTDWFRLRVPMFNLWKNYADKFYFIFTDAFNINMMKFADVIIQHRAGDLHLFMNKVEYMWPKGYKKPIIIHDVDDNEFDLPDSHPLKQMWIGGGKDQMSMKQLTEAHHITTTGRILKRMFSKFNQINKIDILPNAFQWNNKQWQIFSWEEKENLKPTNAIGRPVVGWAGLTSHFPDLVKMQKILKVVSKKSNKNPFFILSGMPTEDKMTVMGPNGPMQIETPQNMRYKYRILNGYEKDERGNSFEGYIQALGKDNIEAQDVKQLYNYGEFYDQYDINLAYLAEKSSFNKAKSAIKVIEGFRKGAISVWTQWGGYEDFYNQLPQDLKIIARNHMASENDDKFAENILFWLNNPEYRKEVAEKFREYVSEQFDIEAINNNRINIYSELLNKGKI